MILTEFPSYRDHSSLASIPEWPRWARYEHDPPRTMYITRFEGRLYTVIEMAGDLPEIEGMGLDPDPIYFVALTEMTPEHWGDGPNIVSFPLADHEQVRSCGRALREDLGNVLTVEAL